MTIFSIFRRPPPASILAFLQSDFACLSHGTGAILRRVFRQILGTFRGQKVHFSAILDHFFDFSRQFLLRFWVRNHKTTHQHMPNNFVFHHIPILGPKKYPPTLHLYLQNHISDKSRAQNLFQQAYDFLTCVSVFLFFLL